MDGFNGATIFLTFLLTAFVYMVVPLLSLGINGGKKFDKKKAKKIALWNSIIVGLIFCILTINGGSTWNAAPALLYYWINKRLLTQKDSGDSPDGALSDTNVVAPQYKKEEPYVVQQPKITSSKPVQTEFKREEPFKVAESKPSPNSNASSLDHFISQNNIEVTETKKAIPEVSIEKTEPKPEPKKQVRPDSEYDRRITELERQLNELKAEREAELKANSKLKEDEEGQMYIDF